MSYKTLFLIIVFLLIPIVFLLRLNQHPKVSLAEWWHDSWTYRQAINVSSHTASEANVFITTTINIGSTAKSQADNGDFRFTTQSGQLLSYYRTAGVGTTTITFHIQLDDFPAGAQTLYAYYGNPSADNGFSASDFSPEASDYILGSYSPEETSPGPLAYWKFDESIGTTVYDSSGHNYHGNHLTGVSRQTSDLCPSGPCLYLDGTINGWTNLPVAALNGLRDFTIGYWMKTSDTTKAGTAIHATTNGNNEFIAFDYRGLTIYVKDSLWASGIALNDNRWHQVNITRNGTSGAVQLYIDGVYRGGSTLNTGTMSVGCLVLGQEEDGVCTSFDATQAFLGHLDDVKIYPYTRTATQIKQEYTTTLAGMSSQNNSSVDIGGASSGKSLSDGLVGYWKLDEGVGTTSLDSSGNNNTATFGSGTSAPSWVTSKFGVGPSFDGDDYININDSASLSPSVVTVSAWVKANSYADSYPRLITKNNTYDLHMYTYAGGEGRLEFDVRIPSEQQASTAASQALALNTWYHLTGTFDGNAVKIYINGELAATTNVSGAITDTNVPLTISRNLSGGFDGLIDEVRVYNRALSATEVKTLYNYAPAPIAHWKMDEAVGTTAFDSSGHSLNLGWTGTGSHWATGKYNKASNFNGTDDHLDGGTTPSLDFPTQSFTYSLWVNSATSQTRNIISNRNADSSAFSGYSLYTVASGNAVSFRYIDGTQDYTGTILWSMVPQRWYHLSLVWDRQARMTYGYVNGQLTYSSSNAAIGNIPRSATFKLGNGEKGRFNGLIDEVKIYNYARTQRQVVEDMNSSSPLAYYKFDEGRGTTLNNSGIGDTDFKFVLGTSSAPSWNNLGKFGKSLSFGPNSLSQQSAYHSAAEYTSTNQGLTLSSWFFAYPTETDGGVIISKPWNSSGGYNYYLRYNSNQTLNLQIGGSTSFNLTTTDIASTNSWHYVAATIDTASQAANIYIDGRLSKTGTNTVTNWTVTDSNIRLSIGCVYPYNSYCMAGTSQAFNGLIDEVKVYSYALTPDEIKADYNQGASLVVGQSTQTIGATTTSLSYCLPGDTSPCSPPIAEWKMDEGVGTTTYDTSGNSLNATFGPGTSAPIWNIGKIGKSLAFNGTSTYIQAGTSPVTGSSPFTLSAWLKQGTHSDYGLATFIGNASGNQSAWIGWSLTSQVGTNNSLGGGFYGRNYGSGINDSNWHYVSLVFSGGTNGTAYLYIDGILRTTDPNQTPALASTSIMAGKANTGTAYHYNGLVDDVKIYNYARTPGQIAYDYNRGGPIGWWKLDECQGATIYDSSGVGNTGTINIGGSGSQTTLGTCTTGPSSAAWTNGSTGKWNSSLNFDGTDDYASVNDNSSLDSTSIMSLSTWIYTSDVLPSSEGIIMKRFNASEYWQYGFARNSNTLYWLQSSSGVGWDTLVGTTSPLTAGTWHHLVGTNNGTTARLYIDGVDMGSDSSPASSLVGSTAPLIIGQGRVSSADNYFTGKIDDVRLFNYPLTSTQVQQLYSNGAVNFR